jgi:hypothetical protein
MARLTEAQRRRIREENMERRARHQRQMTDREAAALIGVPYNSATWAAILGGWGTYGSGSGGPSSSSYDSQPSTSSDSGSCGGGGGCD